MESHTISESLDGVKTVNLETEADVIHSSPHQGGKCSCLDNILISSNLTYDRLLNCNPLYSIIMIALLHDGDGESKMILWAAWLSPPVMKPNLP